MKELVDQFYSLIASARFEKDFEVVAMKIDEAHFNKQIEDVYYIQLIRDWDLYYTHRFSCGCN